MVKILYFSLNRKIFKSTIFKDCSFNETLKAMSTYRLLSFKKILSGFCVFWGWMNKVAIYLWNISLPHITASLSITSEVGCPDLTPERNWLRAAGNSALINASHRLSIITAGVVGPKQSAGHPPLHIYFWWSHGRKSYELQEELWAAAHAMAQRNSAGDTEY